MKFWIAVISKDHIERGIEGGFIQVCHGKQTPLRRMKKGDYILVYSSKISINGLEKCQSFTAIGQVADDEVFKFQMAADFIPYRRKITFLKCEEVSILPLINELEFISNKKAWGYPFRFGFLEILSDDFDLIASKMLKNDTIGQSI